MKPSTLAYKLADAAYALHTALEQELHAPLEELGLTLPLADVLWQLDPALGPISRRELAERLHCDPSNVTFLVNRLEHRRLVARARPIGDRRVRHLSLTPAGLRAREHLLEAIARSPMFDELTVLQQRQLSRLLGRCIES